MLLSLLLACEGGLWGPSEEELLAEDNDADGFSENQGDCDDAEPRVFPDNPEVCDGLDNNCDGFVDEGEAPAWFLDADSDGYGGDTWVLSCTQPGGYVPTAGDCDESDPQVNPEGVEEGCDGVDDDCDGEVDEGFSTAFYVDADRDGYGDPDTEVLACEPPGEDYVDNDFDCDDEDVAVNPLAADVCNGQDDDCDGEFDEDPDTVVFQDLDGDGFGTDEQTLLDCSADEGWSSTDDDCDDSDPDLNPTTVWYLDVDGDGYGVPDTTQVQCLQPNGYAATDDDCDDGRTDVYPEAEELCDGADQDCDGAVDEGSFLTFYLDQDGDGYGLSSSTTEACSAPSNYVADSTDCDDTDEDVNPGEPEVCDGNDQNCDGQVDEDVGDTFYLDADGDGFGLSTSTTVACALPSGYAAYDGDCNDGNASINPNGTETCNAADDDCDGQTDEGVTTTYYEDGDGDSYGLSTSTTEDCNTPSGYADLDGDCDDADSAVNPAATEICENGIDDDCDGSAGSCGVSGSSKVDASYDLSWYESTAAAYGGWAVSNAGDLDGDGADELLMGSRQYSSLTGRAYLAYGGTTSGDHPMVQADYIFTATGSYGYLGESLASGVDFDLDGTLDYAIGASNSKDNGQSAGAAYVLYGPNTSTSMGGADITLVGSTTYDNLGSSLTFVPDTDGDGYPELAAGAWQHPYTGTVTRTGLVALMYGNVSGTQTADVEFLGAQKNDYLGRYAISGGDMNGDGVGDLAMGGSDNDIFATDGGSVYVSLGPLTSDLTVGNASDFWVKGTHASGRLGTTARFADIDGDGYDDLMAGAPYHNIGGATNSSGGLFVFYGPRTGVRRDTLADAVLTSGSNHYLGEEAVFIDDMDGDGNGEVAVSGLWGPYEHGRVLIWNGPLTGTMTDNDAFATLEGQYSDHLGASLTALDWDGDGTQDLAVGATREDTGGTDAGMVYILLGGGL